MEGASEVSLVSRLGAKLLLVPGASRLPHLRVLWHVGQRVGPDNVPGDRNNYIIRQHGAGAVHQGEDLLHSRMKLEL